MNRTHDHSFALAASGALAFVRDMRVAGGVGAVIGQWAEQRQQDPQEGQASPG
ncbi:MAG: hypothetical protein U1E89_00225 [Burkholderiaceae bacterium]